MKKSILFGSVLLLGPMLMHGQALLPSDYHTVKNLPSPTVSSMSIYGDIPIDLFTGTPQISIPLTSMDNGNINIPLSLSYHSSGIRVADRPGWAGLGWDLMSGGQITRKTNWFPDEYYNRHPNIAPGQIDQGYYFLGNRLNTPDWNTFNQMQNYTGFNVPQADYDATVLGDGEPDEFMFNFGGYSGSFFLSETGEWKVKSKQNITLEVQSEIDNSATYPLYFDFSIIDGSPIDNTYAINNGKLEYVASLFTKFTITTPDGFKYQFGGNPAAIEFSRGQISNNGGGGDGLGPYEDRRNNITANAWNLTKITTPQGDSVVFNYQRGKVIFTENRYFSLQYGLASTSNNPNANSGSGGDLLSFGVSATNPSYLASIESQTKRIDFVRSQAVELPPETIPLALLPIGTTAYNVKTTIASNWKDLGYAMQDPDASTIPNYNQQLDSIKVFDKINGAYVNGIKFFQRADAAHRRTLDSIAFYDVNSNVQKYRFQYSHVDDLPFYESLRRDHWGYFNGGTEPTGPGGWPNHNSNELSIYGLISKIIYPTGGETDFEFEPGYYGNTVHVDPNNTQPISLVAASASAGVRIKSITSSANYGSPALTTQYFYSTDYADGGNNSSGVLGAEPRYSDEIQFNNGSSGGLAAPCGGQFDLVNRTDDNSEWVGQAKSGLVTYSEVTRRNSDGSFVTTKYTNNDNPLYQDELAVTYANIGGNTTSQNNYRLTSNDIERGKVLSEAAYNSSAVKVKETLYSYVNDPARKNQFSKCFGKKVLFGSESFNSYCPGPGLGGGMRTWAYKIYSYQNPVKNITETTIENGQPITNTKSFSYDVYGNVTQTISSRSDNDVEVEDVRYNSNSAFQGTTASSYATRLKNLLGTYRIKNYPVERTITLRYATNPAVGSDRIIGGILYEYDNNLPLLSRLQAMELDAPYYPETYSGGGGGGTITYNYVSSAINSSGNFVYDSKYKVQETINAYSTNVINGQPVKPIDVTKISGNESYTWDYGSAYLSSIATNCSAGQAAFSSFEGSYLSNGAVDNNNGNWQFYNNFIVNGGFTGKKCISFFADNSQQAMTSTFVLPVNQAYTLSFWYKDKFPTIKQGSQSLGQSFVTSDDTWKYFEIQITGNGSPVTLSIGLPVPNFPTSLDITYLDEVRLYPVGATMKTYTYNPYYGLPTSIGDETGKVNFYEYDSFGRLTNIKDQNGNILKSDSYQYQVAQ